MQIQQLQLNLWDAIDDAKRSPIDADFFKILDVLDSTLAELDTEAQLSVTGTAVNQIVDLFCDRSSSLFEELHSRSMNGEPIMSNDAFDRYVRRSMVIDLEQFIEPLPSLARKQNLREQSHRGNSIVGVVDQEVLIQALEQANLLSSEEELAQVLSTAHAEDVAAYITAISNCIANHFSPMRLIDLDNALPLTLVELWLGLLLGDFKLKQKGSFYSAGEIWVS